jgi:hypothetical protein
MLAASIIRTMLAASVMDLMMEAASTSETPINFCQTARHYNSEYSHLHARRHGNLKSHVTGFFVLCFVLK